uniref:Uncharacterized protein n=1 Tax=viral metagenome TaxID=1070528 RepID=A0A6C0KES0_9ZZZZ
MSIEELREERDMRYQEQTEAFQAWMDAEIALEMAVEEEKLVQYQQARAKRFMLYGLVGVGLGMLAARLFG